MTIKHYTHPVYQMGWRLPLKACLAKNHYFKNLPMTSTYYEYLKSLPKEQLIRLIYKPMRKRANCPGNSCRKVALRISYDGRNYKGVQYHPFLKTISDSLYNALEITNLRSDIKRYNALGGKELEDAIDTSTKKEDDLAFCGRTDAGVSAISMVVSLTINSHLETPNRSYAITEEDYGEYPYDVILNQHLPEDIRITGWAPVPDGFSARYDCVQRHYRYYFTLKDLNLERMRDCARTISEMDDFYCLSTHSNPKAIYKRKLDEIGIYKLEDPTSDALSCVRENIGADGPVKDEINIKNREFNDIYYLEIKACGFLHNMVRKIFWLIQNCGKNNAFSLKNVQIASPFPLVFVGAKFKNALNFISSDRQNKIRFMREAEEKRVLQAISRLKLEKYGNHFDK